MTLNQLFDLSLDLRRDQIALEWQGCSFTFGETGARARRMANALRARGIQQGDRVSVQLANCVESIDLYLACVRLGAIFVPLNVLYREREVAHILNDAAPRLFVTRDNLDGLVAEARAASDSRAASSGHTVELGEPDAF
jgi:malonyl-CoA/methylmalonyl-CoA synthetase